VRSIAQRVYDDLYRYDYYSRPSVATGALVVVDHEISGSTHAVVWRNCLVGIYRLPLDRLIFTESISGVPFVHTAPVPVAFSPLSPATIWVYGWL